MRNHKEEEAETDGETRLRAVVYLVSTTEQDEVFGCHIPPVDVQRWLCSRVAIAWDAEIVDEYVETLVTWADRPMLWKMMYALQTEAPADLVITYSEDLVVNKEDVRSALHLGSAIGKAGAGLAMCVPAPKSPSFWPGKHA